jgi:hypothetical protein
MSPSAMLRAEMPRSDGRSRAARRATAGPANALICRLPASAATGSPGTARRRDSSTHPLATTAPASRYTAVTHTATVMAGACCQTWLVRPATRFSKNLMS